MKKSLIVIPLLVLTLLLTACGDKTPDKQDTPTTTTTESAVEGGSTTSSNTGDNTTGKGDKQPTDNVVNWEDLFGADDTTTGKDGKTTTSTTKKKTTTSTAPTTTLKPTTIDKVSLPAVGSDVDGRGRIKVSGVSLKGGVMAISIRNYTDEQKTQWITEETDYVTYACYDKNGKQLTGTDANFGYLYLGCLEDGDEITLSVELPKGTASVQLTGSKIAYWTPWS